MNPILLVDALSILRPYYAVNQTPSVASGLLLESLQTYRNAWRPAAVFVVFDSDLKTFRHELYPQYKSKRPAKTAELVEEIGHAQDLLATDGFEVVFSDNDIEIYSRDSDFRQLLSDRVVLVNKADRRDGAWYFDRYTAADLMIETGLEPWGWLEMRIIAGKPDHWPGAKGVGEVTATKMLTDGIQLSRKQRAAIDAADMGLGRKLMTMRTDVPLETLTGE